jgi:hypothetical protein
MAFKKALKIIKRKENWQLFILPSDCMDCTNAGPCLPESIGLGKAIRAHMTFKKALKNY